jgi:hypothetical protein
VNKVMNLEFNKMRGCVVSSWASALCTPSTVVFVWMIHIGLLLGQMLYSEKRTWSAIDLLYYRGTTLRCIVLGRANLGYQFTGWRSYFRNSVPISRTWYSAIYHRNTNNHHLCLVTLHETTKRYTAMIKVWQRM